MGLILSALTSFLQVLASVRIGTYRFRYRPRSPSTEISLPTISFPRGGTFHESHHHDPPSRQIISRGGGHGNRKHPPQGEGQIIAGLFSDKREANPGREIALNSQSGLTALTV